MMLILALALAAADPTAEALALGQRLADAGTLAAVLPMVAQKETEELVAEHPEWSEADKAAYRATAAEVMQAGATRLKAAIGRGYAQRLSVEDLRVLVAFQEGGAAKRWRDATPGAMMEAMGTLGALDFKGDVRRAFCQRTGKGCPAP